MPSHDRAVTVCRPKPGLLAALAIALASVLMLAACVTAAPEPEPTNDGKLAIATSYGITDISTVPMLGPGFGYTELLMRPEANGVPSPWVLSKLEQVDQLRWRMQLNEGVKFVNGKAFDASALVKLLKWSQDNNPAFSASMNFAGATQVGPLEVELKTSAPTAALPNLLADEYIGPVIDVDGYDRVRADSDDPADVLKAGVFTGPFRAVELSKQGIELVPVENYWQGQPALREVSIRFVTDETARVQAVQSGEVDLALYVSTTMRRTLEGRTDSFFLEGEPQGLSFGLISRPAAPVMQDAKDRQAIFAAVDYREIAEDVLGMPGKTATGIYSANFSYHLNTQRTDIDAAKRVLQESGWIEGDNEIRSRDGKKFIVRVLCDSKSPDHVRIAEALQSQLRKVGIEVSIREVDDYRSEREGDGWELALTTSGLMSYGGGPDDAMRRMLGTGADGNWAGISDPDLDALLAKLATAATGSPRDEVLRDIQQLLWDRGYFAAAAPRLVSVVAGPEWKNYEVPVSMMWVNYQTAP